MAQLAGVSQPTVSRVFSSGSNVTAALKQRVEAAAHELGYRPNTLARSLITGKSRTIGVIVAYLDNPFYSEALEKLSAELKAEGYHILIFFAANLEEEIDPVVEELLDQQVDGIILASVSMSNRLTKRLDKIGLPFVLFNRGQMGADIASVTAANYQGGFKAGQFLIEGGHQKIAHISGWQKSLNGRERQQGFCDALTQADMAPIALMDGAFNRDLASQATRDLLSAPQKPDAIFVGNDHMAFAVLDTLREELGVDVPSDLSVIGYDDVRMAAWKCFDLTTLRQPANRMVKATVRVLLAMMTEPDHKREKIEIESDLIIRGTARIPTHYLKQKHITEISHDT